MIHWMDRQTRNIGLLTLLLAALTIVAVISPEKDRSTLNTAILFVAVVAAVGSVVFLIGSATPLRVVARDISAWREKRRRHTKWRTYHYRGLDQPEILTIPKDDAILNLGTPCLVLVVEPPQRAVHRDPDASRVQKVRQALQGLKGFEITCSVSGRGVAGEAVQVEMEPRAALARFPDEYFGRRGTYRAEWTITWPDGRTERTKDTIRLHRHGETRAAPLPRVVARTHMIARHLLGRDLNA
jgi:hypothetical protein